MAFWLNWQSTCFVNKLLQVRVLWRPPIFGLKVTFNTTITYNTYMYRGVIGGMRNSQPLSFLGPRMRIFDFRPKMSILRSLFAS